MRSWCLFQNLVSWLSRKHFEDHQISAFEDIFKVIITPKIKVLSSLFQTGMTLFHLWKTRYLEEPLGPNSMKQFSICGWVTTELAPGHIKRGGIYISIGGSAVVCVCGRGLGGYTACECPPMAPALNYPLKHCHICTWKEVNSRMHCGNQKCITHDERVLLT